MTNEEPSQDENLKTVRNFIGQELIDRGYNHIMLDIEALGTDRDCVIVSVGAVRFNLDSGHIIDKEYWELNMRQQQKDGRTISADTINWWSNQSPETIKALQSKNRCAINEFIGQFNNFIQGKCWYWAKGTNYDMEIVGNLYEMYGHKNPFKYSKWVDARVFYMLGKKLGILPTEKNDSAHNALADAEFQTRVVTSIYKTLSQHIPRRNQPK